MKFSKTIDDFLIWRGFRVSQSTKVRNRSDLRFFCLVLNDPEVESITIDHVLKYLDDREKLGWTRNDTHMIAQSLRQFFHYLKLKGCSTLDMDLIPLPRRDFKLPRVATQEDFDKIAAEAERMINRGRFTDYRNRALLHMVWDTWARIGEIMSLDVDDLQFKEDKSGKAMIRTEKSQGRRPIREIFWSAKTGEYLQAWLAKRAVLRTHIFVEDSDAVFVTCKAFLNGVVGGKRLNSDLGGAVFHMLSEKAQLPVHMNPHSARHFGARKIITGGGSTADVANLLGHASVASTHIYTMMWGEGLEERWKQFQQFKIDAAKQQSAESEAEVAPIPKPVTSEHELLSLPNTHRSGKTPPWRHHNPPF